MRMNRELAAQIRSISGGDAAFNEFYNQLRDIREYHRRYPGEVVQSIQIEMILNKEKEHNQIGNVFIQLQTEDYVAQGLNLCESVFEIRCGASCS